MVKAPHPTISVSNSKLTNLVHPYHLGLISSCMVILTHLKEKLLCTWEQVQNTRQMTDKVAFWSISRQPARRVTGTLEVDRKESSPHQKMIVFCENDEWMVYEILPHTSSSTIYPPLWFVILNQTVERYPGQWTFESSYRTVRWLGCSLAGIRTVYGSRFVHLPVVIENHCHSQWNRRLRPATAVY